jgi:malate dehydrogenase (oxaloacetate-decarboxylating)(NADP+)
MKIRKNDALNYHSKSPAGKIEVVPTKPFITQRDLSLAYSPGVAYPCLEIEKNENDVYKYTNKGNLVAVISNGTAVLGLGDIGASASKPVMEGKGGLFKAFADIDVFDIELNSKNQEDLIKAIEMMGPTFGGINLEDIKAPESFEIEKQLQERLDIPVFHDDQHGTAIISGAALINALLIAEKKIEDIVIVYNGAGAAAIACAKFHMALGVNPKNVYMCDRQGIIYKGRKDDMNKYKKEFEIETDKRTLEEAMDGADIFMGLSVGGVVSKKMVKSMADTPIIFAMANPDPEITYNDAKAARDDVIMATGRSDYPNQVNNVLGFPFIFRGALDVYASAINLEMKVAAAQALAELAREDVPETVKSAYGVDDINFGPEYIIPKPFDPRVLTSVSPAVAQAAMDSGVARKKIKNIDEYKRELNVRMGRTQSFMSLIYKKARRSPKKVVFPEGDNSKIIRAAQLSVEEGIAKPILLGVKDEIKEVAEQFGYDLDGIEIINPETHKNTKKYIEEYYKLRQRRGVNNHDAEKRILKHRNYFASTMVAVGDADCMLSGLNTNYAATIRPALQTIGHDPRFNKVSGLHIVSTKKKTYFLADTTVNINPTAHEIADIAIQAAELAQYFEVTPQIALLSYGNFGSATGETPIKMREARNIIKTKRPELIVDGEMQADIAVRPELLESNFPFSEIKGGANVLVFPDLNSGNIAYKLLSKVGSTNLIGPILIGMSKPVHILEQGSDVHEILDMVAIAVVDAQEDHFSNQIKKSK